MFKPFFYGYVLLTIATVGLVEARERAADPPAIGQHQIVLPGTAYEIVLGRAQVHDPAGSSAQALLAAIETWLSIEFDLPAIRQHPRVEFASAGKIAATRFRGLFSAAGTGMAANDHAAASAQADTVAVYDDHTQTIYLPEGWSGSTPGELSVLVHEVVHHFQNLLGLKYECSQEREKLAYMAQDRFLGLFGHTLANDFALDPFSLLVKTGCIH